MRENDCHRITKKLNKMEEELLMSRWPGGSDMYHINCNLLGFENSRGPLLSCHASVSLLTFSVCLSTVNRQLNKKICS